MVTMTFKVSEDEARRIRSRARKEGVSVSEYLRRRARQAQAPLRRPKRVRCPHTGAMVFLPIDSGQPLTTDMVRTLLVDFP